MAEKYRIKLKDDSLLTGVSTKERIKLAETTKNADILRELSRSRNDEIRENVVKNKNCPVDILRQLAEDKYYWVRARVAQNPNTPVEILKKLAEDEEEVVRSKVASNPNTPVELLRQLAKDVESLYVREGLASNPNTSINILRKLAKDEHWRVRIQVVKNTNCPDDLLKELSGDKDDWVRKKVVENPNTPADVLKNLSRDKSEYIRSGVAQNPSTPVDILGELAEDNSGGVRDYAKSNPTFKKYIKSLNLNKLDEIAYMSYTEIRELAKDTKDADILRKLSNSGDGYVREYVAGNINTPEDVLNTLAKDIDSDVRRNAKNNPNYKKSEKQQSELSKASPSQIRTRIFKGSKESRIEALKYALDNIERFDNSLFELVAELNVPYLNEILETHPNTPDELFEK